MANVLVDESALSSIASAIREKNGTETTYKPAEMAPAIQAISGGDIEIPIVTGYCGYRFAFNGWNSLIPYVTTKDITSCDNMFIESGKLIDLSSLVLNCAEFSGLKMFALCYNLEKLPKINISGKIKTVNTMFSGCERLKEIPDDYLPINVGFLSYYDNKTDYMFSNCQSLRKVPLFALNIVKSENIYPYNRMFQGCSVLDTIENLGVNPRTLTSNYLDNPVSNCFRLKDFTFEVNEDNTPKIANWKSQTLYLTDGVGYCDASYLENYITKYNSGITTAKRVSDDASYQALKNDPDWYTLKPEYSRYNHDSAVRTINSLPDTSAYLATAGGTNTIIFKGTAGSATDGGAINTLTDEEIAVATSKGWTITLQ